MSSGSTTTIVVLSTTPPGSSGGSNDDNVRRRTCYGVVVGCVSLFLFCVLAATVGVVKACVVTGLTAAFFGIVGWLVPRTGSATATDRRGVMGVRRVTLHDVDASRVVMEALRRVGYSCSYVGAAAVDIPPAFAYESCPADAESGGKSEGSVMCAVCLEDVQQGEMVRRLPACGHLFHKDCIDMWLHSHTTCPLCRCELSPRRDTMRTIEAVAAPSAADVLPPV